MQRAFFLVAILAFIGDRAYINGALCPGTPTKDNLMTASFVDVYGGQETVVGLLTSDGGFVYASLINYFSLRIGKLNQDAKLIYTAVIGIGNFENREGLVVMEVNDNLKSKWLLFLLNINIDKEGKVISVQCDLASCSIRSTERVTLGDSDIDFSLLNLHQSITGNIYATGFQRKNNDKYPLIMKYDPNSDANKFTEVSTIISKEKGKGITLHGFQTDNSGNLIFAGIANDTLLICLGFIEDQFNTPIIIVSQNMGIAKDSLDLFTNAGALYVIVQGALYSIDNSYEFINILFTDDSLRKAAVGSLDGNSILYGKYSNNNGMVSKMNVNGKCFYEESNNSVLKYIKIASITKSEQSLAYFISGSSTQNLVKNFVVAKIVESTSLSCVSSINYYNTQCMSELTSGCHPACNKCLKINDINACTESNTAAIILFSARSNNKQKVINPDQSESNIMNNGCNVLCGGMCTKPDNINYCAYYCSQINEFVDDSLSGMNKCGCQTGYIFGKYQAGCVSTQGCSDLCDNNECPADRNLCFACQNYLNMGAQELNGAWRCTCDKRIYNKGVACLKTSNQCHKFCDGTCVEDNDRTTCGKCNPNLPLISGQNGNLSYCNCKPPYFSYENVCALRSNCAKGCADLCIVAQDNTKCLRQCDPNIQLAVSKSNGDGTLTCIPILMEVVIETKNEINNLDRCKGIELVATVTPSDKQANLKWSVLYSRGINIPESFISSLTNAISSANSTLKIPHSALIPGMTLNIAVTAISKDNNITASGSYNLPIPPSANIYCGPCQLTDRGICEQLNGVCWNDFDNVAETPFTRNNNCLLRMAPICYKIWKANGFNTNDQQCKEYLPFYNISQMIQKPALVNSTQVLNGKPIISLEFDTMINNSTLYDCGFIFTSESLQKLGPNPSCLWITQKRLEIIYSPLSDYATNITIKEGIIRTSYTYSMETMESFTAYFTPPAISFWLKLSAPKSAPPSSPITLRAEASPDYPVVWTYAWSIKYISQNFSTQEEENAMVIFKKFQAYSQDNKVIVLPISILYPNNNLKVTLNAKNQYSNSVFIDEKGLNITEKESSSIGDLNSKSTYTSSLDGNKINNVEIPVLPNNYYQKGGGESDPSQGGRANSSIQLLGNNNNTIIAFEVKSGDSPNNMTVRGTEEIAIEEKLSSKYNSLKLLSISSSSLFKFYVYYNLTIMIQYYSVDSANNKTLTSIKTISSSSLTVFLTKKAPECQITSPGYFISPNEDNTFSSKKSVFYYTSGDVILYYWDCVSCKSLINNYACSCNIFNSELQRQTYDLVIPKGNLANANRYNISVKVSIIAGGYSRTCTASIEVTTVVGAKSGLASGILSWNIEDKSAQKNGKFSQAETYLGADILNTELVQNVNNVQWNLIEVTNKTSGDIIGSIKSSLYNQLLKDEYSIDTNIRRAMQSFDKPIPNEYIPIVTSSPNTLPPVLGLNKSSLKPNIKYTYSLKLSYKGDTSKSSVSTVTLDGGSNILQRDTSVYPQIGYAYSTMFTFDFSTVGGAQTEDAIFSLYRSDCWNGGSYAQEPSEYILMSTYFSNTNYFATIMAPGKRECNYLVKVKIRVDVGDKWQELNTTVIVMPFSDNVKAQKNKLLDDIAYNYSKISFVQSLSFLSQISYNIDKTNDISINQKILDLVTKYDTTSFTDLRNSLDTDELSGLMEILIAILKSVISSDYSSLSKSMVAIVIDKLQMYCRIATNQMSNGRNLVYSLLSGFDTVLVLRDTDANMHFSVYEENAMVTKSQINQITSSIYLIVELKLKEMVPGGSPYTFMGQNIGLSLNSLNFALATKDSSNLTIISQNQSFALFNSPYKLYLSAYVPQGDQSYVLAPVLLSIAATPMNDIKKSTIIDTKYLRSNSLANGKITAETMKRIYDDMRSNNWLDSCAYLQLVPNKNLFFGLYLAKYDFNTGQIKIETNASLSNFTKEIAFGIVLNPSVANDPDTPRIPLYYLPKDGVWTNQGCYINEQVKDIESIINPKSLNIFNMSYAIIRCNWTNLSFSSSFSGNFIQVAIDSFHNFKNLIAKGAYPSDFDFNQKFTKLKVATYIILFGVIGIIVIIALIILLFERNQIKKARIKALISRFEKNELAKASSGTIMERLSKYLIELKNIGFGALIFSKDPKIVPYPNFGSYKKNEEEKDLKQVNSENVPSPKISDNMVMQSSCRFPNDPISPDQESDKEILDLYEKYKQWKGSNPESVLSSSFYLDRLTSSFLEDNICLLKGSFCGFFKSTHLLLSVIFTISTLCSRTTKILMLGSSVISHLFLTATFLDSSDSSTIKEDRISFVRIMFASIFFSIGITIILKIVYQFFLKGKYPQAHLRKEAIEEQYKFNDSHYYIGLIIMIAWTGICIWQIIYRCSDFNDIAMTKWLYTFLFCIIFDIFVIETVKVMVKLLLNIILMLAYEKQMIFSHCGKNFVSFISSLYYYFT